MGKVAAPDGAWRVEWGHDFVRAVSTRRLPFDPRGPMLEYRTALRSALMTVKPVAGCGLIARYGDPDGGFVDAENVLLYNVGAGAYSHLVGAGLAVFREPSRDDRHNLRYTLEPIADTTFDGPILAEIEAPLPTLPHTPGEWWSLLSPHVVSFVTQHLGPFHVDVVLDGPCTGPRIAGLVKPMLDGLISALHSHDGTHQDALVGRLAHLGPEPDVWSVLCDPTRSVIGVPRPLVRPHRKGIAWNPADDQCTAFRVLLGAPATRRIRATVRAAAT